MDITITALWQAAPEWFDTIAQRNFKPALSLLGLLLTPVAVLVGGLGAWRFGADAGWTNSFFIADGVLSHWQVWCAFAIGLQTCAYSLKGRTGVGWPRACMASKETADGIAEQPGANQIARFYKKESHEC